MVPVRYAASDLPGTICKQKRGQAIGVIWQSKSVTRVKPISDLGVRSSLHQNVGGWDTHVLAVLTGSWSFPT